MNLNDIFTLILLLAPVLLIQLGLAIYALLDLHRRAQVRGQRWVWALVLILTSLALPSGLFVSALYLVWGRNLDADAE